MPTQNDFRERVVAITLPKYIPEILKLFMDTAREFGGNVSVTKTPYGTSLNGGQTEILAARSRLVSAKIMEAPDRSVRQKIGQIKEHLDRFVSLDLWAEFTNDSGLRGFQEKYMAAIVANPRALSVTDIGPWRTNTIIYGKKAAGEPRQ